MKRIKVSEATNTQLDWLVAKCEGAEGIRFDGEFWRVHFGGAEEYLGNLDYTTDWSQMGPIIEREKINLEWWHVPQEWHACMNERLQYDEQGEFIDGSDFHLSGPTPLIAAARCYVASKLGESVEVPEELE